MLRGDRDNDLMIGVDPNVVNAGFSEIDTLYGGSESDTFVLGDELQIYYDDGDSLTAGVEDYALIQDFDTEEDIILLKGSRADYRLGAAPEGLPGGATVYRTVEEEDELIAILRGTPFPSLDGDYYVFI